MPIPIAIQACERSVEWLRSQPATKGIRLAMM